MTYSTPELLLVGAAQHLVLGVTGKILEDRNHPDGDFDGYDELDLPMEGAW